MFRLVICALGLAIVICPVPGDAGAQDWASFRGNDGLGSATPGGVLASESSIGLKQRWKRKLGSGYSSVVVSGDRVVTMYADGEHDLVICLDRKNGETVWQSPIAPAFKGENGSFDGPIATPVVHGGFVYALDPNGAFVCLALADGRQRWVRNLVDDDGAVKPLYGFATSPIMVGETLVLQTGVAEKSLAGFNPESGEVLWTATNDKIDSQSPAAMDFHGTPVVLVAGGKNLSGVDAKNGRVLFEFAHEGGNGSAMVPVPIEGDRVVLTLDDGFSKAVSLRPGNDNQIAVSEEWQNRSIKNTYNVPALRGNNLYAYSTRILTCVDPATGEARWKSREPGDGFLIVVDNHLIINTKQGSLHIARGDSEEYQPVASMDLFEDLVWSLPAYSDNAIFARSLGEIACIDIVPVNSVAPMDDDANLPVGPGFAGFLRRVYAADGDARSTVVDELMDSQSSFPIVEGSFVQFVYRGKGKDVAVASDMFGARQERKMEQIEGTDFFWYSTRLEDDQRASYMFLVDYVPQVDPRNNRSTTSSVYAGEMEFAVRLRNEKPLEMSWFAMPDWKEPEYLKAIPETMSGKTVTHEFESELLKSKVSCEVYLPPGYDSDAQARFRVAYIAGGPGAHELGQIDKSIDKLFTTQPGSVPPAILVFVNYPPTPEAEKSFLEEMLPSIDGTFRTIEDRAARTMAGFGFASGAAISTVVKHPELFGNAAIYSPLVFDAELDAIEKAVAAIETPLTIYLEWGRFDMFNPHENWDVRDIGGKLVQSFQSSENIDLLGGMVNDSHDWSSWRNRYTEFLKVGELRSPE